MSSEEAWRAGHHAATAPAWVGFVVISVAAILSMILFGSTGTAAVGATIVGAIFVVTFLWLLIAASRAARTAEVSE
jgi:tryptophan-rich sensory protein